MVAKPSTKAKDKERPANQHMAARPQAARRKCVHSVARTLTPVKTVQPKKPTANTVERKDTLSKLVLQRRPQRNPDPSNRKQLKLSLMMTAVKMILT